MKSCGEMENVLHCKDLVAKHLHSDDEELEDSMLYVHPLYQYQCCSLPLPRLVAETVALAAVPVRKTCIKLA